MSDTVTVRIAVVVGPDGNWYAAGDHNEDFPHVLIDEMHLWDHIDAPESQCRISIVEADVPMPELPREVLGQVTT